jgi:hypothetical protein
MDGPRFGMPVSLVHRLLHFQFSINGRGRGNPLPPWLTCFGNLGAVGDTVRVPSDK